MPREDQRHRAGLWSLEAQVLVMALPITLSANSVNLFPTMLQILCTIFHFFFKKKYFLLQMRPREAP
jgi:hypothetical protein